LLVLSLVLPIHAQSSFRAIWADSFNAGFKSTSQIDTMVQRAVDGNYNAIIAEVMAYQDTTGGGHGAYWNSSIVPKALDIVGGIDPLAELCTRAHAQGIEVHAWIVTYRVSNSWPPSGNGVVQDEWIMVERNDRGNGPNTIGGHYNLDPGSPDVQNYIVDIVRELVTNYPIDGINLDYIRYLQSDAGYPSDNNYAHSSLKRYQQIYNTGSVPQPTHNDWNDFRRRTVSELVRRLRVEIPSITSNPQQPLRFTADLIAFGDAPLSFTQSGAYQLFQDWRLWMEQGWLDAGIPMNYKREHCSSQATMYRNWVDAAVNDWRYDRHIFCGQGNYLNSFANSVAQMQYVDSQGADGVVNFSYAATRADETLCDGSDPYSNDPAFFTYVGANLFTSAVPTPPMPWRDPSTATEGTVWGRIQDWDTSAYVDDATVQIGALPSIQTDANGYYTLTLVPASPSGTSYSLSVSASGLPGVTHPAAVVRAGEVVRYDFSLGSSPPFMGLSTTGFVYSIDEGDSLADDTFTVSALAPAARGPVNYVVSDDAGWLSVSPLHGVSTGEADTITITYDVTGLTPGIYTGTVTVADALADNTPQTVIVDLTVATPPVPGDFDLDGDVDMVDYSHLQACLLGDSTPQTDPNCQDAELTDDLFVSVADVAAFMQCLSGSNNPANPDCLSP
jgi:uncharacterized lipoprotein YddW (UPF0748 family)